MNEENPVLERISNAVSCAHAYGQLTELAGKAEAYLDVVCYPLPEDVEFEESKKKYTREFLMNYPFLDELRKWYGIRAMNTLQEFLNWLDEARERGLIRAGLDLDRFKIPVEVAVGRLFNFWAGKDYEAPYDVYSELTGLIKKVENLNERVVEKAIGTSIKKLLAEKGREEFYREVM